MKFADLAKAPGAEYVPPEAETQPEGPGELEALGRGALQGGSLGFSDEITGGIQAALDKIRGAHEDIGKLYAKHRDEARANNAAAEAAHPELYGGAKIAGGLVPAIATAGESLPLQLAGGAAIGGLGSLGESDKLTPDALKQAGLASLGGAAGAGLGGAAAEALGGAAGGAATKAGEALENLAPKAGKVAEDAVGDLGRAGILHSVMTMNPAGLAGAIAGPALKGPAGKAAEAAVGTLGQTLGRVGRAAATNPKLLGKYGAALASAAKAGPEALAATHLTLAQTDPEFQKKVLEIQNEHPELDGEKE